MLQVKYSQWIKQAPSSVYSHSLCIPVDRCKHNLTSVLLSQVNCNDDQGIVEGKWHGSYKDGVNPSEWSSSADILHQWVSSNCKPVCYGQCWVYASVLCTGTLYNWDTQCICTNLYWAIFIKKNDRSVIFIWRVQAQFQKKSWDIL